MTDEQAQAKRERDRRASAAYRARQRAEAAEKARAAADGEPGPMRQSVDAAIAAAKWLGPSDAATIAQLRSLADVVDVASRTGDVKLELRAHSLLSRILADAALTPRVRLQHELRSLKVAAAPASDAAIAKASNVTRFPRPAKRPQ